MQIRKVTQPNRSYLKNPEAIVNWFDKVDCPNLEGYYSIYDTMGSITASAEAAAVLAPVQARTLAAYGNLVSQQDLKEINQQLNRIKKPD